MSPKLILIRHAQGWHNATDDGQWRDPALTPKGIEQCAELQKHMRQKCPLADDIGAIVSSPMRRTLETTKHGLGWKLSAGIRIEANAKWQENGPHPCDRGSEIEVLKTAFSDVDFSNVDPLWPAKKADTLYAFDKAKVLERAQACLKELHGRPEKAIAVVSHAGFLRTAVTNRRFENADYRVFQFADSTDGTYRLELADGFDQDKGMMGRSEGGIHGITPDDFSSRY